MVSAPTIVSNAGIRQHAERLAVGPVSIGGLSTGFEESHASSAEVLVEGRASTRGCSRTSPRRRRRSTSTSSASVRESVGDRFAEALLAKARRRHPGSARRRPPGLRPRARVAGALRRLSAAGAEVCVVRATKPRPADGPLGDGGATRWNLAPRAHRPPQGPRRRRPDRLGRRRRNRGSLRGRALPRPVPPGRRARSSASCSSCSSRPPLARRPGAGGRSDDAVSRAGRAPATRFPPSSCTTPLGATGRSPTRSRALLDGARETLDVVNPYVTDRGMIRRIEHAARRGVRVRLFVPANANNWACAAAQQFHHARCSTRACGSSSTRPCSTPRRSCATARSCSRERATSRRGASSGSSRSTSGSDRRRSRRSSTSASAHRPKRSRRPGGAHRRARAGARESSGDPLAAALHAARFTHVRRAPTPIVNMSGKCHLLSESAGTTDRDHRRWCLVPLDGNRAARSDTRQPPLVKELFAERGAFHPILDFYPDAQTLARRPPRRDPYGLGWAGDVPAGSSPALALCL